MHPGQCWLSYAIQPHHLASLHLTNNILHSTVGQLTPTSWTIISADLCLCFILPLPSHRSCKSTSCNMVPYTLTGLLILFRHSIIKFVLWFEAFMITRIIILSDFNIWIRYIFTRHSYDVLFVFWKVFPWIVILQECSHQAWLTWVGSSVVLECRSWTSRTKDALKT